MAEFASRGVGNAGLTTGIIGSAGWLLNGGLNNLLSGLTGNSAANEVTTAAMLTALMNAGQNAGCSENHMINRYEAGQQARIAELETEVKLRDANTYTDQKSLEMYQYIDGRLRGVEGQIAQQAVFNQKTQDSFALAQADLSAVKAELKADVKLEAERRCCADNSIVNYSNATFYPKMVADVTAGTTTTAQNLYNPIPQCGCCGNS